MRNEGYIVKNIRVGEKVPESTVREHPTDVKLESAKQKEKTEQRAH